MAKRLAKEPNESVVTTKRILGTDGDINLLVDTGDDKTVTVEVINDNKLLAAKLAYGSDLDGLIDELIRMRRLLKKAHEAGE